MASVADRIKGLLSKVASKDLNPNVAGEQSLRGLGSKIMGGYISPTNIAGTGIAAAKDINQRFLGNNKAVDTAIYGLRGASQLTPFQPIQNIPIIGKKLSNVPIAFGKDNLSLYQSSAPTNARQEIAQSVGRNIYGSILTSPFLGGSGVLGTAKAITSNAAKGALLGTAMGAGTNLITGKPITKQSLAEGALSGFENSWILPVTGASLDAVLGKAARFVPALKNLQGTMIAEPFKSGEIRQGIARTFTRALLEVVPENTAFTFLNQLSQPEQEAFTTAWMNNLPGAIVGNLISAGMSSGTGIALNKQSREALSQAYKKATFPVTFWTETGRQKLPAWQYDFYKKAGIPLDPIARQRGSVQLGPEQPKLKTKQIKEQIRTATTGEQLNPMLKRVGVTQPTLEQKIQTEKKISTATTREKVASDLEARKNSYLQDVLGYSQEVPSGGTKEASLYTKALRSGQEIISSNVERGMMSENPLIRNVAVGMQNFFRGAGMSPERAQQSSLVRGGMAQAYETGSEIMKQLYDILPEKSSRERINAVLDPAIAKKKISFEKLNDTEKQVYTIIRKGLDLIHDESYVQGRITKKQYLENKGKYTPRQYTLYEIPEDMQSFVYNGKKINTDQYKKRGKITEFKQENALNDPIYALGKVMAQVETNRTIKNYTDYLAKSDFVSDTPKPGFTKVADSPAYGSISGKYVMQSALEDLKGFYFSNATLNSMYDAFKGFDRLPIRQLQKKLLTVFNPTTHVGNIVSDQVFGFMTGVDPFTLNKNLLKLQSNPSEFKQLKTHLTKNGIVGTDITRTDFTNKLKTMEGLSTGENGSILKTASSKIQGFYGGTDDNYKIAAFKSLLDKGFSTEEATRRVADGFQNYANVGKFYDVWAKTPIVGEPFIKFQGDLLRMIKNAAVNNPLSLITFLGTLKGISYLSSKASGETDEDRKTREERFAAPIIPGLNIPLTWQTPIGEINVARYISPFYSNVDTGNPVAKMLPFSPTIAKDKQGNVDVAGTLAQNVNDPLLAPPIRALINRDFRNKPISDPNMNQYTPSLLTKSEQNINKAKYVAREYLPPPVNSAIDVASAIQGKENRYGQTLTPGQAIARLGGIKISQFGPKEAQAQREKDAYYSQKGNEDINKQLKAVDKGLLTGSITPEQAAAKIDELTKQKTTPQTSGSTQPTEAFSSKVIVRDGKISYLDENETQKTIDFGKVASMPEGTNYEQAQKTTALWKLADSIVSSSIPETDKAVLYKELGMNPEDITYHQLASSTEDEKYAFLQDKMGSIQTHEDLLKALALGRKSVGGKMFVTSGVLSRLEDDGLITTDEKKFLAQGSLKNGKFISGYKGKKPKKFSVSVVTPRKVSLPKGASIKFQTKPVKAPSLKTRKVTQVPDIGAMIKRLKVKV